MFKVVKRNEKERDKNKERIKKSSAVDELSFEERELFLNAFHQGEIKPAKKTSLSNIEKKEMVDEGEDDQEDDNELFLRAVFNGIDQRTRRDKEEKTIRQERKIVAKRRDVIEATIDLHGMFADQAIDVLLRFIENEKKRGSKNLLIIHGKGSGVLKNAVQSIIDTHPQIENWRIPTGKWGGQGAIVIKIKRKHS